jgi:hypothetical protein
MNEAGQAKRYEVKGGRGLQVAMMVTFSGIFYFIGQGHW